MAAERKRLEQGHCALQQQDCGAQDYHRQHSWSIRPSCHRRTEASLHILLAEGKERWQGSNADRITLAYGRVEDKENGKHGFYTSARRFQICHQYQHKLYDSWLGGELLANALQWSDVCSKRERQTLQGV